MASDPSLVPQLVEADGPYAGRVHAMPYGEHLVGRGSDADIRLDHKDVSRLHARVDVGPDGVTLFDLGSKNGVIVGGQRISGPVQLGHGQSFSFGDLTLTINHPASQVARALAQAGETTATTALSITDPMPKGVSIVLPLVGVLIFGGLVAAMLLL